MEHPCQQCGAAVEDGRPFCPQCRAPQIHVQVVIPEAAIATGLSPVRGGFSPELGQAGQSGPPIIMAGSTMNRRVAVRAALKAGLLGVFIALIPLLGIVLTGALAVFFYRRENGFVLPAVLGARLGAAAGLVVFAINALFTIPIILLHAQQQCVDSFVKIAEKYGVNTATPQFQASIQNLFTPAGLVSFFIVAVVLASFGGALASLFLRSGNPRL